VSKVSWSQVASRESPVSDLDVNFAWRDFGEDVSRINAVAISPDEELRLYVVAKGYDVAEQVIPKLAEGEERELTVTLKSR